MRPDGILVLNLFDPLYDLLLPGERQGVISSRVVTHPISRNMVRIEVLRRVNDPCPSVLRKPGDSLNSHHPKITFFLKVLSIAILRIRESSRAKRFEI